jgi:xanthine dehydrogenase accessory factor
VLGYTEKRVVRAPCGGAFPRAGPYRRHRDPGPGAGRRGATPVTAPIAGLVRGLIADGIDVPAGIKIGDVDPRGPGIDPARVSDKARAVAAGVLEAVLVRRREEAEVAGQAVLR